MKKSIAKTLILIPTIALQLLVFSVLFGVLEPYREYILGAVNILAFIFILIILPKRMESNYKVSWIIVILLAPIFGGVLYMLFGNKRSSKPINKNITNAEEALKFRYKNELNLDPKIDRNYGHFLQIKTLSKSPCFKVQDPIYYSMGEKYFNAILSELEKAEKFIFIEFYIVEPGKLYEKFIDVLKRKVDEGVDVRFIYDDFGSYFKFSLKDLRKLKEINVKTLVFNQLSYIHPRLNNRDHRKMVIIDGKIAFSGGNNLADEYANYKERFGVWKDIGFSFKGDGVKSYTYMFAAFWNAFSSNKIPEIYLELEANCTSPNDGIVASYYDSPFYEDAITNSLYCDILSSAKKYVWIYTPYLFLPQSLNDALIRAAKRGIDVRILIPGIPDKKLVYRFSKSYCPDLMRAGVRIYTYTPGFLHAKALLTDDVFAAIGTVNLDFRSLYLHYENNSVFYRSSIVDALKQDMIHTMSVSDELDLELLKRKNKNILKEIIDSVFRIIAPLF
ncbi:MAG: cardiolipin synthase [Ezakiella sp.]|nr:cardiolipin synthase [Ezakiella sp.]MDD7472450.1 cardiolipin synthase [Bacillota bacterium]MDY3923183.1 cardiolipin synthase [Ezakiella sp.]